MSDDYEHDPHKTTVNAPGIVTAIVFGILVHAAVTALSSGWMVALDDHRIFYWNFGKMVCDLNTGRCAQVEFSR